jgi:hypothetical protein
MVRNMKTLKVVEKIQTHILCSMTFFQKLCHLWGNVEWYGRARQAIDDDNAHVLCVLDI